MRDLTSIEAMLPDLQNKLAFMYYTLVEKSKHLIVIDKSEYRKAEAHLNIIPILLTCDPDVEEVNYHLNEFLKYIDTCCIPEICEASVVELQCNKNEEPVTFWIPDGIACEITTTTTTTSTTTTTTAAPVTYGIYATVTSFSTPDLVDLVLGSITQIEFVLKAETGSDKQFFLIQDTLPKALVGVYYFSYSLGIYINVNKISDYTYSLAGAYRRYLYNGTKRGSTKVKLVFS